MNLLLSDAQQRPGLFRWNGPIDDAVLKEWLNRTGVQLPRDLVQFYIETGGGDFFESETIFGPFADARLGDDLVTANEMRRAEGMASDLFLFHSGVTSTAIEQGSQRFVRLDGRNRVEASFESFNEWYYSIRQDFAQMYGLTKLAVV